MAESLDADRLGKDSDLGDCRKPERPLAIMIASKFDCPKQAKRMCATCPLSWGQSRNPPPHFSDELYSEC